MEVKGLKVTKILYGAAIIVNALAALVVLYFMVTEARGSDILLVFALLTPPVLSVVTLLNFGSEERRLERELRVALLKKELRELKARVNTGTDRS